MKEYPSGTWPGADIDAIAGFNVKPVTSVWAEPEMKMRLNMGLFPRFWSTPFWMSR